VAQSDGKIVLHVMSHSSIFVCYSEFDGKKKNRVRARVNRALILECCISSDMKRTKARPMARSKASASAKKRKTIDLTELREEITAIVKSRAVSMVDTTIAEADKGHFAAMKYLFEMIGLYPAQTSEEQLPGESVLAKTLIRRLGLREEPALAFGGVSEAAGKMGGTSSKLPSSPTASQTITATGPDAVMNAVK
jgi:hypothetical protein